MDGVDLLDALGVVSPFANVAGMVVIDGVPVQVSELSWILTPNQLDTVTVRLTGLPATAHLLELRAFDPGPELVRSATRGFTVSEPLALVLESFDAGGLGLGAQALPLGEASTASLGGALSAGTIPLAGGDEIREGLPAAAAALLHDRDGDGAFAPTPPETVVLQNLPTVPGNFGELAIDPNGRVAYAYVAAGPALRIAYDRNGDGDFTDGGEIFTAFNAGAPHLGRFCGGLAFDASGRLAAAFGESSAAAVRVFRDLDGDGDFADAADLVAVLGGTTTACDVSGHPSGGLAVAHSGGAAPNALRLLVDRNDDGDFGDANEEVPLAASAVRLAVTHSSGEGRVWVAGSAGVFVDQF